MTRVETAQALAVLKEAYPHSFKGLSKTDRDAIINLWAIQFESDPPEIVNAAINAMIATRKEGYSPTIAEVKEQIFKLKSCNEVDESTAWACVSAACRNGIYGYREEFNKLPPEVQRVVKTPEQLRDWAMVEEGTFQTVVASNFQKQYRARQAREKELAMLPMAVRDMLSGVAGRMMITE